MNKYLFLCLASPLSGLPALAQKPVNPQQDSHPNVILINADDLGYGDLSCYGAKNVQTPNVDSLARSGVRFVNAHCAAATSTPSRYSLLTGQYAWRRKNTDIAPGDEAMIIKPSQFTLADVFKANNYATAVVGKWHLGLGDKSSEQDWNAALASYPGDLGFDYSYIMAATADRVPCVFIENGKVANYDSLAPIKVSYKAPLPGELTAKEHPELLTNLRSSHGHMNAIVNGIGRIGYMTGGGKALWKDQNIADSIVVHAKNFIRDNKNRPFFLYLATNDIHVPRFPNDRFRGKNKMGLRGDAIAQFDWSVGQVLSYLRSLGLSDKTLIILTSDNGPVLDDGYADGAIEKLNGHKPAGALRGGKYSSYEGGTRIPFIVSWPGHVPVGKVSKALVSQVDIAASMAKLLHQRLAVGQFPDSDNELQAFLAKDSVGRKWVVEQALNRSLQLREKDWKYIEPSDTAKFVKFCPEMETGYSNKPQLYNLSNPYESKNVADKYPEKVKYFQKLLADIRAKKYQPKR